MNSQSVHNDTRPQKTPLRTVKSEVEVLGQLLQHQRNMVSSQAPSTSPGLQAPLLLNNNNSTDVSASAFLSSSLVSLTWRSCLGMTVLLYAMNQKHMLPKPLSAIVSKALFWPTLPITIGRRLTTWMTRMDETVVMGGAPFQFLGYPKKLREDYNVRGVINMCEEYKGPLREYRELGMEELHLPTTDHFEPSYEDLLSAVAFIQRHKAHGNSVYVHCRAGHGRSAAVVYAWCMYQDPMAEMQALNHQLSKQRNIRKSLWKQPNLRKFHDRLREKGLKILLDMDEGPSSSPDSSKAQAGAPEKETKKDL